MVDSTPHRRHYFQANCKSEVSYIGSELLLFTYNNMCVWFDFRSVTLDMASTRKKGGYKAVDPVDVFLLNQVVKHVNPEELDTMARDLFVDETVYQDIQNPKNRIYKVMN